VQEILATLCQSELSDGREGTLAWADFQMAVLRLMTRVHTLLQEGAAGADAKEGACRNLLKREAALWTFVWKAEVEPTNNRAERARPRGVVASAQFRHAECRG
jgi:hypothetical protein